MAIPEKNKHISSPLLVNIYLGGWFFLINLILLLLVIMLITLAVRIKAANYHKRNDFAKIPEEIKLSPASKALAELIAIAGGIYISLSVLTSFLSLSIPERIQVAENLQLDPLAMLAIIITLIQPIVLRILRY